MNKIFLFIILLFSAGASMAQTYVPFPTANTLWTERHGNNELQPPAFFYCFGLKNADTTINAVTYHKLYRSEDSVLTENEFYGGLREDAKKIYLFEAGSEKLIYDFNLNVGDTFPAFNSGQSGGIVTLIDSVNVSGTFRKRYAFKLADGHNTPWGGNWIEGIGNGNLGGLPGGFALQPTCDCAVNNLCMRQDGFWLYHNPQYSSTNCISGGTSLHDPQARKQIAVIAPNPVIDISQLIVEGNVKFDRMEVYDSRGWKVKSYAANGKSAVLIHKKEYAPGLYLYRLSASGRAVGTGKFTVK